MLRRRVLGDRDDLVEAGSGGLEVGELCGDPVAFGHEQRERLRRGHAGVDAGQELHDGPARQTGREQLLHEPHPLDITDEASVAAAAAAAQDVTLLVNNAGIATTGSLLRGDLTDARREMDTHYWGTLSVLRAFAPVIERNGGGAVVNVLSALSWFVYPGSGGYAAAKAAEWNLTNAVRLELASAGITVQGLHLGAADTDITAGYEGSMVDPADVARASLDGVEAGVAEVLVDEWSRGVKASLQGAPEAFYAQFA